MAGLLSPQAQMKVATLRTMLDRVQHVHGQVERYAATNNPGQANMLTMPMKRAFGKLKLDLMGAGLDSLSQLAGAMEIAAGRGTSKMQKTRILREGVGSMRFQVEQEQRKVVTDDQARQRAKEKASRAAEAQAQQEPAIEPAEPRQRGEPTHPAEPRQPAEPTQPAEPGGE